MDNKNQDVAKTILTQMGGINRISAMVSGHNFVSDTNMVKFHFKGSKKANIVRITLTPCDLYNVEFFKFNRKTLEYPKTGGRDGIYADQLIDIFEGETGLFLKL